jgi:hypothetical protein
MQQAAQTSRKRPKLVWVIFLLTVLSVGYTALSSYLVLSGTIPLGPEEARYFQTLRPVDYAVTAAIGLVNVAAAIALFRLRSVAVYLYAAALAVGIVNVLVHAATTSFVAVLGGPGIIGASIGLACWTAVCIYAWRLKARGVLT